MTPLDLDNQLAALDAAFQDGGDVEYVEGVVALAPAIREYLPYVRALRSSTARCTSPGNRSCTGSGHAPAAPRRHRERDGGGVVSRRGLCSRGPAGGRGRGAPSGAHRPHALPQRRLHFQGDVPQARRILAEAHELAVLLRAPNRTGQAGPTAWRPPHERRGAGGGWRVRGVADLGGSRGDLALRGQVLRILGWIHYVLGNHGQATREFEEQRRIALQLDSTQSWSLPLPTVSAGAGWSRRSDGEPSSIRGGPGRNPQGRRVPRSPAVEQPRSGPGGLGEFPAAESASTTPSPSKHP